MKNTIESVYKDFVEGYEYLKKPNPFLQTEEGGDVVSVSPVDYWNKGRKIFNALVDETNRRASEKWKSNYSTGLARNKILGLVAHVVSQYMSPSITAQNKDQVEDRAASKFVKDILEQSLDKEKFTITQFFATLTSMAEGMCVIEENYYDLKRKAKEITDTDEDTGECEWEEKEVEVWKGPRFNIIPNDQYIPQNPYARNVDDNDWVIVYHRGTKAFLGRFFGSFGKWEDVTPGLINGWASEEDDTYKQFVSQIQLSKDEVVVIKRYNLVEDTLDIIANGVQLTQDGYPIPRPVGKKRYPIALLMAEPIDNDFYMGKSIAERLSREQAAIDLLYRMFFDREFLNTFPPLETDDESLLTEDLIAPKVVIARNPGSEGTRPILQGQVTSGLQNLIALMEKNADQNSIGNLQLGQTPTGGTPTATQTLQMAKNAEVVLNMFNEMQRMWIVLLSEMRIETLLWRLDKDELKQITVHDRLLSSNKRGSRKYFLERGLDKLSEDEKGEVSMGLKKMEDESDGKLEAAVIDPDMLVNHTDLFVHLDAQPSPRRTSDLDKMLTQSKFELYARYPQVFNIVESAKTLAEVMGDDPETAVLEPAQQQPPQAPQGQAPQAAPSLKQAIGLPR